MVTEWYGNLVFKKLSYKTCSEASKVHECIKFRAKLILQWNCIHICILEEYVNIGRCFQIARWQRVWYDAFKNVYAINTLGWFWLHNRKTIRILSQGKTEIYNM